MISDQIADRRKTGVLDFESAGFLRYDLFRCDFFQIRTVRYGMMFRTAVRARFFPLREAVSAVGSPI